MRTVKESSDELNPQTLTSAFIAPVARGRTALDYLALGVATCGVGFLPLAPGTWGSALGVGVYLSLRVASERVFATATAQGWSAPVLESVRTTLLLWLVLLITGAGVWAATRAERLLGRKDPGAVVVDEVAGQLITFLFVPWLPGRGPGGWTLFAGFLAFRLFDIWKPYPVRRLEGLGGGLGIMADDMLAGFYAAAAMSLLVTVRLVY